MSFLVPSADPATAIAQLSAWWDAADPEPLLIETSGSTGRPKRVVLSRGAVAASVAASAARLGASGRWLLALPSSYVAGVQVICRSLAAGHEPVVVGSFAGGASDPGGADVATFTSLVPTQLHRLLDDEAETAALARLHTVLLGGGPIPPDLRRRADAAGLTVVATYGASETAGGCVYDGLPLDGVGVAIGADGRIRLTGPTIFDRYDGDPELTAKTLVDGWYLTSDAGRLDEDGRLQVLGRLDDVVVSGGVNVPLPAVAARLLEHAAVAQAEVVGVDDEEWGTRVVAVVVLRGGGPEARSFTTDGSAELREWVAAAHPRSWAPRDVVRVDALPLLANGKVDRAAVREVAEGRRS